MPEQPKAVVKPLAGTLSVARRTPNPPGRQSAEIFRHGSMELRYYAPRGRDNQTPHDRDELYVIATGHGRFRVENEVTEFKSGDVLFAASGADHRFEEFSDDVEIWVMFYGPVGGEKP